MKANTATLPTLTAGTHIAGVSAEFRSVATSRNPALRAGLATIPDVPAIYGALVHLAELAVELRPAKADAPSEAMVARLVSREMVSASDVRGAATAAALAVVANERQAAILNQAQAGLISELQAVVGAGVDTLRAHLDGCLASTLEDVRRLQVDGLSTAEEAIELGKATEFGALKHDVERYTELREAQRMVDILDLGVETVRGGHYRVAATMSGAATSWPGYGDWARAEFSDSASTDDMMTSRLGVLPPWPTPQHSDSRAMLLFLAGTDQLTPWVPSGAELREEIRALAAAQRLAGLDEVERAREGRGNPLFGMSRAGERVDAAMDRMRNRGRKVSAQDIERAESARW